MGVQFLKVKRHDLVIALGSRFQFHDKDSVLYAFVKRVELGGTIVVELEEYQGTEWVLYPNEWCFAIIQPVVEFASFSPSPQWLPPSPSYTDDETTPPPSPSFTDHEESPPPTPGQEDSDSDDSMPELERVDS